MTLVILRGVGIGFQGCVKKSVVYDMEWVSLGQNASPALLFDTVSTADWLFRTSIFNKMYYRSIILYYCSIILIYKCILLFYQYIYKDSLINILHYKYSCNYICYFIIT